jgi:hypothetical protein
MGAQQSQSDAEIDGATDRTPRKLCRRILD